jgi:2'-5' RNA ligase
VIERVERLIADLSAEEWPVRWVNPGGAHLTLHFLGDTAPERAELLRLALPGVVARHQQFALRTAGLGVFPNYRRPRVIWLGLHGPTHRLDTLHRDLGELLTGLGFEMETAPPRPHITLGRLRDLRGGRAGSPAAIAAAIRARLERDGAAADEALPVPIHEVVLYRSILSRTGAHYTGVSRAPLAT